MSANLDALVAGIRAKRNEKLPQAKKRLAKLEAACAAVTATQKKAAAVAATHPELQAKLGIVGYDLALSKLNEAINAGKRSVARLSRASINIGVAGKARQGKSQILQMLTGLGDKQIPTGDGGYCTGSRSEIRNAEANRAVVYFKEKADLMERIILPTCRSLSVSPCPGSVSAFMQLDLPPQPKDPEKANEWNNLIELQRDLNKNSKLMSYLGSKPMEIGFDDLRRYVTKDEGDREFQVVDHVEIETRFDSGLPQGMLVFDLPGLRDPAPGVRDEMLKSIKEDSDIVFLMRRPDEHGDDWGDDDIKINRDLHTIYAEDGIEPKDWLLLVMNHVRDHEQVDRNGRSVFIKGNEKNLDDMLDKVSYRFPGFHAVKCDCGSKDAVRNMVAGNIEVLVQQTSRIDDLRIRQAETGFAAAMDEVRSLYRKLREASADIIAQQGNFDLDEHFREFMSKLRDPLKNELKDISPDLMASITTILRPHFDGVSKKMEELYAANENNKKFPDEFPIFTKKSLIDRFGMAPAPFEPVGASVRNQREALFKLCRTLLEGCCNDLNEAYFSNVVAKVFENEAVRMATHDAIAADAEPRAKIEAFAKLLNQDGSLSTLVAAVSGLLSFNLSFESAILPAVYGIPAFADFNPERPTTELTDVLGAINDAGSKEERAEILYAWQKYRCEAILSCATSGTDESPLSVVTKYVANIMQANFNSFVFRFIWGEDCEDEWERLVRSNQAIFWKDEFEAAERNSAIARDWNGALAELKAVVG